MQKLKTLIWIDQNPMRGALLKSLCKQKQIEVFIHQDLSEMSEEILESILPSLIVYSEDFSPLPYSGRYKKILLGSDKLPLPLKPLDVLEMLEALL